MTVDWSTGSRAGPQIEFWGMGVSTGGDAVHCDIARFPGWHPHFAGLFLGYGASGGWEPGRDFVARKSGVGASFVQRARVCMFGPGR
jgi:hypothetical protein